ASSDAQRIHRDPSRALIGPNRGVASSHGLSVSMRSSEPSARMTATSPYDWGLCGCSAISSRNAERPVANAIHAAHVGVAPRQAFLFRAVSVHAIERGAL